jgi:hypothetical protein
MPALWAIIFGAAAGSEGTATYQAVVPDTNEEGNNSTINVTFLVRFCDSYSADNNYWIFHPSFVCHLF